MFGAYLEAFEFNRTRTLATLDAIAATSDPAALLGWRPGLGRAHVAWQLMHIGITEEIFAVERLASRLGDARHGHLWDRFRGGSVPDDQIPSCDEMRKVLADGRQLLLETLQQLSPDQLDTLQWLHPKMNRMISLRTTLYIIGWHESHHQGQAHITVNLYNNRPATA